MSDVAAHRATLLRHCYRMLGSFADAEDVVQDVLVNAWNARDSYAGNVPIEHWLMRIATNACLNELARRKRRVLPQLECEPASSLDQIGRELESIEWITPAPDRVLETREHVALAFIALLQRLPPRQRAVLLLKDVVGWSAEEIATTLDTTVASVSSALHRARETIAVPQPAETVAPPPEIVREYIRSWEQRDLDTLVRLLRDDVVFAMPPHATWFRGPAVGAFFRSARLASLWTHAIRIELTRANGELALAFFSDDRPHSLQVVEFVDGRVAQAVQFIGAAYLRGFTAR